MPKRTITLTLTVDDDEWMDFRASHLVASRGEPGARDASILGSFDARMDEVFGPDGSVLTGANVVAFEDHPLDLAELELRLAWLREACHFKLEWMQRTGRNFDEDRVEREKLYGQLEAFNTSSREIMYLRFPELSREWRERDRQDRAPAK
jgi:hypothetical protein